jgi:hypothetical protein
MGRMSVLPICFPMGLQTLQGRGAREAHATQRHATSVAGRQV